MDGDIAIAWQDNRGAFSIANGDLATDAGLETAVVISLFTDNRAGDDDELPAAETDRRGWWGNGHERAGDEIGSKLWLLRREKQMPEVVRRAEEYAREALRWMVEDKVAGRVQVFGSIPRDGWLYLDIRIWRPDGTMLNFKYDYNWQEQKARRPV